MVLPGAKPAIYRYAENTFSIRVCLAVPLSGHEAISRVLDQIDQHLSEAFSKNRFTTEESCCTINIILTVFYLASVFLLVLLTGHVM